MTIRISNNAITFGNFTLTANTQGFTFDGKIRAKRGFIDSRTPGIQGRNVGFTSTFQGSSDRNTFPFAVDTDATTVGALTQSRTKAACTSSRSGGYIAGGTPIGTPVTTIDRFPFALPENISDAGDLATGRFGAAAQSSETHGYASGGGTPSATNNFEKYPFASTTSGSSVGTLAEARQEFTGVSSRTHGYSGSGYFNPSPTPDNALDTVDRFPFAVDTNATDIANLADANYELFGNSSEDNGYFSGGVSAVQNNIQKIYFSSDGSTSDIADLTVSRGQGAGVNSLTHGYCCGGWLGAPGNSDTIDKFPFASDNNATDVGNMSAAGRYMGSTGHQN